MKYQEPDDPPFFGILTGFIVGLLVAVFSFSLLARCAHAHEDADWIRKGGYKNAANEWCCGEVDCVVIPAEAIRAGPDGYELGFATADATGVHREIEVIPYSEALPSQDGRYWRCHRNDGSRRCFFAPPPSY